MASRRVCLVGGGQEDPVPWKGAMLEAGAKTEDELRVLDRLALLFLSPFVSLS
jgi:hypothetical protein